MKQFFTIILLLSICIQGCDKFDRVGHRTANAKLKSYFDFKPESTWTYKDDSSGLIEKIVLVNRSTYDVISNESDSWKYHNENIEHTFSGNIGINKQIIGSLETKEIYGYRMYNYGTYLTGKKDGLDYYAPVYPPLYYTKDSIVSIWVSGKYYEDVLYFKSNLVYFHDQSSNIDTTKQFVNEYWVAANAWIIKMIDRTPEGNRYWSLMESKVYQ